jgi:site-specific recombinase XerD
MKLQPAIEEYIAFRKALGARFTVNEKPLRRFARLMGVEREVSEVQAEEVRSFLDGHGPLTSAWHVRHNALAGFYRYALSRGYITHFPLPTETPKRPRTFVPYIYSCEELRRLFEATTICQQGGRKLNAETLRAILLLLYGAGLRSGEALSLKLTDVDLAQGVLVIREAKFFKTRMVPVGKDLHQELKQYAVWRREAGHSQSPEAPFFVYRTGTSVNADTLREAFERLRRLAGVRRNDGARYQPRLHDLRHAFAVHRLTAWYQNGADVQKLLPALSTYLGHDRLAETQVYLTMTPELLRAANERFAQYVFGKEETDE